MTPLNKLRATGAEEATALGASFVGSEHLFLAWLVIAEGPAREAAAAAGLTAESFRAMLGSRHDSAKRGPGIGDGGLSSHAQRVLTSAHEIAGADGRDAATADDAFLAMIREPRGAIARALTDAKLKPSQLKTMVRPGTLRPAATPRRRDTPSSSSPAEHAPPPRPRRDPELDDIPEPRAPERPRLVPPPKPARPSRTGRRWSPLWALYAGVPISIWLHQTASDPFAVFVAACLAIIPLASLISTATEHLAERTGPMLGALLNAAFGNATEVIVAIAALNAGYIELVKASLTGSILSNLLLILGLALFTGGLRQPILRFNRVAAGMSAAMLALAVAALMLPSLLHGTAADAHMTELSQIVAAILALSYVASLVFTLRTHKQVFAAVGQTIRDSKPWSIGVAIVVLAIATAVVAVESELLVDTIVPVTQSLHLTQVFLGLIVIPIVGNAAEHATAIVAARKGKTELALQIALGSSTQVALLVAPLLVLVSVFVGQGMDLAFPAFQVGALGVSVVVAAFITLDGESHWLEGLQLLALYAMIAAAAWFI
jgi:Ca2+:H+ antiporter